MQQLVTNLTEVAKIAEEKEHENDAFRVFLKNKQSDAIDNVVHQINDKITAQIDCTQCGRCCKILMIHITEKEANNLANHLRLPVKIIKEKYIEESEMGEMIINTIPCHFLSGKSCSIYENRFNECREFPHLHKPNFTSRLFGTLMHYAICPIVFNVVEELKIQTRFKK